MCISNNSILNIFYFKKEGNKNTKLLGYLTLSLWNWCISVWFSLVIIWTTSSYILRKTEKPAERRRLQKPKPNIMKLPGKKEAVNHEKMEAETSSPNLVNITEKVRRKNFSSCARYLYQFRSMFILCTSYCLKCSVVRTACEVCVRSSKSNISCCACFCQDRINFLDNDPSGAVFWIHNDDSADNTEMF